MKPELKLLSSAVLASGLVFAAGASRAADDPNGWAMYGRGYDNTRYSPLDQINTQNVSGLKLAYAFSLGSLRSNEATPLVVGDTLYVSSSWGPKYVYALDAKTGPCGGSTNPIFPTMCCSLPAAMWIAVA